LLKSKKVLFAGYRIPHPLEHIVEIKVQTTPDSSPAKEVKQAMELCIGLTANVEQAFEVRVYSLQPWANRVKNELTRAGISTSRIASASTGYAYGATIGSQGGVTSSAAAGYMTPGYATPGYGLGRD